MKKNADRSPSPETTWRGFKNADVAKIGNLMLHGADFSHHEHSVACVTNCLLASKKPEGTHSRWVCSSHIEIYRRLEGI